MLELYVSPGCPYCAELREQLDWDGRTYVEHDVQADDAARRRLFALAGTSVMVPVLVEDGRIEQIGWQGRGCYLGNG
jgi:mycoredoxin